MRPAVIILIVCILLAGLLPACSKGQATSETTQGTATVTSPVNSGTTGASPTELTPTPPETLATTTAEIIPTTTPAPSGPELRVVGYITNWHLNRLSTLKLDRLTHLIFQGVVVTSGTDPTLKVANEAGWWQISDVATAGHAAGVKVLISLIGLWTESSLNQVWKSQASRQKLIENLLDLIDKYQLDGVDLDNENKGCNQTIYSTFIKELYNALNPHGKIISIAGNPLHVCVDSETFKYLDFINVMTYDMWWGQGYPFHSTLEESVQALKLWVNSGAPKDKILIGIPFYGRDANDTFYEYWWIVDKYHPEADQNQVNEPIASGGIIWWNGQGLAEEKTLYVINNGFGGVMMYEIGTDSLDGSSLLESVHTAVNNHNVAGKIAEVLELGR